MLQFKDADEGLINEITSVNIGKKVWVNKKGEAIPAFFGTIINFETKTTAGTKNGASFSFKSRTVDILLDDVDPVINNIKKEGKLTSLITSDEQGLMVPKMCATADPKVRELVKDDENPVVIKTRSIVRVQTKDGSEAFTLGRYVTVKNMSDKNSWDSENKVPTESYYPNCSSVELVNPRALSLEEKEFLKLIPKFASIQRNNATKSWDIFLRNSMDMISGKPLYEMIESTQKNLIPIYIPGQNVVYFGPNGLVVGISSLVEHGLNFFQHPGYPSATITKIQDMKVIPPKNGQGQPTIEINPVFAFSLVKNENGFWPSKKNKEWNPKPSCNNDDDGDLKEDPMKIKEDGCEEDNDDHCIEMIRKVKAECVVPPFKHFEKTKTLSYSGFYNVLYITNEKDWFAMTQIHHPDLLIYSNVNDGETPMPVELNNQMKIEHAVTFRYDCHVYSNFMGYLEHFGCLVSGRFAWFDMGHMYNDVFILEKDVENDEHEKCLWYHKKTDIPSRDIRKEFLARCDKNPLNVDVTSSLKNWKECSSAKDLAEKPSYENRILVGPGDVITQSYIKDWTKAIFKSHSLVDIVKMSHPKFMESPETTIFWSQLLVRCIHYAIMETNMNGLYKDEHVTRMEVYSQMMDDAINNDAKNLLKREDFNWKTSESKGHWVNLLKPWRFVSYGFKADSMITKRVAEKRLREAEELEKKVIIQEQFSNLPSDLPPLENALSDGEPKNCQEDVQATKKKAI